jgi:glycosyltransferase involved in cell wall biosynthesis
MRVALDVTSLAVPTSGVGTYTLNLWEHLDQDARDCILPLAHRALNGSCPPGVVKPRVPRPMNKTLWMQMFLPWQLARLGADVSHFTNSVSPLGAPGHQVITIHDMTLWLFPELHYSRRLLAMRPFIPLAARRAGAIITVSHSAKEDIVRILHVPPQKVHVVYEAASSRFRRVEERAELDTIRARHHLPEQFILYVGTIEPRKNLVRLLEAFHKLKSRHRLDHALILVGSRGWKEHAILSTVETLQLQDSVRFLDHVPARDLVALYSLADLFVFPSLYEGFGLPVIEAMACGTPVVTSDRGSLAEVAGTAAQVVEATDVESIASGIKRVLDDREWWLELQARGLRQAARFSWATTASQTRRVYERVVGDAP